MARSKKAKKQARKKAKTKDIQEYISWLRELHKLQGALLKEMDKCLPKKA